MCMKISSLIVLLSLLALSHSYLQFELQRFPSKSSFKSGGKPQCITTQLDAQFEQNLKEQLKSKKEDDSQEHEEEEIDENENYKEICYEKDISYSIPLYYKDQIKFLSMDLTTPIGWFKGTNCHLEASTTECASISSNFKEALEGTFRSIGKHLKKKIKRNKRKQKLAMIEGSSELVKGVMQKSKELQFYTQDSSRFTRMTELLMLGFWMKGEKDLLQIQNTTFINATEVSPNLNSLCDGAISLRIDSVSEKSFLSQIFDYVKSTEKAVTIFLGNDKSKITIGEISTKDTELGYGGIDWIKVFNDEDYGKVPLASDFIIEDKNSDREALIEEQDIQMNTIFTLSASYIGFPSKLMGKIEAEFDKKRDCGINEKTGYFECDKMKKGDEDKVMTISFNQVKISFTLSELILEQHHKKVIFNIKQTFHEGYAIFGEPIFKKYFVVFDYGRDRIGIGPPRVTEHTQYINIVTLVRFVSFVFLFGCLFILCYNPVQKCFRIFGKKKGYLSRGDKSAETRRLKLSNLHQDDNYDDLNQKVREALDDEENEE